MQSSNASIDARNADPSKAPDYAFVIAGWPTVYTVGRGDYELAGLTGDLADFSAVRAWADFPAGSAAKVKARPEEGKMTLGEMQIAVLDRVENGKRAISSLLSRQAYLDGNVAASKTFLSNAITAASPTLEVNDLMGVTAGQVVHIGLEAILVGGTDTGPNRFTDCTRGYRLTSATAHGSGVNVYGFLPNYYRRKAFVYKGYRQLGLDKWLRAFAGVISTAQKQGEKVTFSLMSTTWETYANGEKLAFNFRKNLTVHNAELNTDVLIGDFAGIVLDTDVAVDSKIGNGHYFLDVGGEFAPITGVV